MEQLEIKQLDLFDGFISAEFVHGEKIRRLEEQQNNLRKGIFRRWKEQEDKIQTLSGLEQLFGPLDFKALV